MERFRWITFIALFTIIIVSTLSAEAAKCISAGKLVDCETPFGDNPLSGTAEELWGEAGRAAYVSAAEIMNKRSPTGSALPDPMKRILRPHFGGLVDRVTIHWATPLLDEWSAARFGIRVSDTESAGQAYGHEIFIKAPSRINAVNLSVIAHEMVHSEQFERYDSSLSNFGYHYFKKYKQAGQNYANNALEVEARNKADSIPLPLGDFDGDGYRDDVYWIEGRQMHVTLSNDQDFLVPANIPYDANNGYWLPGDFNGDGKMDLLHMVTNGVAKPNYCHVHFSNGTQGFRAPTKFAFPCSGKAPCGYNITFGVWEAMHIDRDGKTDLKHNPKLPDNRRHCWYSKGDGSFELNACP